MHIHSCETIDLSQTFSNSHSGHPANEPQIAHFSCFELTKANAGFDRSLVWHSTCFIDLFDLDHKANSPFAIFFPHVLQLLLNLTVRLIQSLPFACNSLDHAIKDNNLTKFCWLVFNNEKDPNSKINLVIWRLLQFFLHRFFFHQV